MTDGPGGRPQDPDAAWMLARLAEIRVELERAQQAVTDLLEERVSLFTRGQNLDPKLTQAAMAEASGVTDVAVTLALRKRRIAGEKAMAATADAGD